jgi:hypothetical protein
MKALKSIGKVVGKLARTKVGAIVDEVALGGLVNNLTEDSADAPAGTINYNKLIRGIAITAIIAYLLYTGNVDEAIKLSDDL